MTWGGRPIHNPLVTAVTGAVLLARPFAGQAKGWVLDSAIDRTTNEVIREVVVAGDKVGTGKPGSAILSVRCIRHAVVVSLVSVYLDTFVGSQRTVTLYTQLDDGPEVAELWPLPEQALPMEAEVKGAAALSLARNLASHMKFSVTGTQSETFHIPNKDVLKALLARCVR